MEINWPALFETDVIMMPCLRQRCYYRIRIKDKQVVVETWKTIPVLNQPEKARMNGAYTVQELPLERRKILIYPYPQLLGKVQLTISTL